ncbi:hypothetical protein COCOBI_17-2950 [Coccomyxa sp. Obi]|nr:hypothetical protein COCOBI_17-2950 [Coccomyxa sp. Obi]
MQMVSSKDYLLRMWSNAQMLAAKRTPAETDLLRVFENKVFDSRNKAPRLQIGADAKFPATAVDISFILECTPISHEDNTHSYRSEVAQLSVGGQGEAAT